ncbi:MAG: aspartate kinase [Chloroflexota bacterium]|nr:aspartate kinase [Chloroflexota bacterium]
MGLVVHKYGGSSVANAERIRWVANRVGGACSGGDRVVVVVSAMGDTTDDLLKLAYEVNPNPEKRELDFLLSTGEIISSTILAMALDALGHKAISLSGGQAGIQTNSMYSRAQIEDIDPQRILRELDNDNTVIVAGFQGVTEYMDVTTLGRGGSDTTAVALAVKLEAERCEIYTDVEGVYTADPRLVPQAQKLNEIDYEEMLELATQGAKVMHSRAVELGMVYSMPILVSSSFSDSTGTLIHEVNDMEAKNKVRGIAHDLNVAKVTVLGVPDRPGIATSLFEPLAAAGVSVDTIVQNTSVKGITDLSFTVAKTDLEEAIRIIEPVAKGINAKRCLGDAKLGKVSIVGTGMQNTPGYASRMFRVLYDSEINIQLITTSEIRITCIIDEDKVPAAVQALHQAFELDKVDD